MKRFRTGDVVYIERQDLIAVVKGMKESRCLIEYIHGYGHCIYRVPHEMWWMNAHALKMDI